MKLLVLVTIYCLLFTHQVNATQINFDVKSAQINQIYTADILATPEPNENAVSIKFEARGVELLDYQKPEGWLITIADCDNSNAIDGNLICVSLAKEAPIKPFESLGKIKFKLLNKDDFQFNAISGNGYTAGKFIREQNGNVLGTTKIEGTVSSFNTSYYVLVGGCIALFVTFLVKAILTEKRSS